MKWAIILLLFLGLVASLSAAVLVGAIKLDFFDLGDKAPQTVTIVVAAKDLPAATIMTPECIEKKTILITELPLEIRQKQQQQQLATEAASVDRVLRVAVVKGTILTESAFLPQGSAEELMAKVPPGMRAFTVNLRSGVPDRALLRPGSIVDVVSITNLSREQGGHGIARPLLNGILVLAVQGESVIANKNPEEAQADARMRRGGGVEVTLQVDTQQAGALQLAMNQGEIALILRNPRDKMTPSMDPIMLDDGGRYITIRPEDLLTGGEQNGGVSKSLGDPNEMKKLRPTEGHPPRSQQRKVIIHRGNKTEEATLEETKNGNGNANGESSPLGSEKRISKVGRRVNEAAH